MFSSLLVIVVSAYLRLHRPLQTTVQSYSSLATTTLLTMPAAPGSVLLAPSATDWSMYDTMYYIKGAAAGGICCSITHGALTPVDVVKTRVQLDPVKVCISLENM